MKQFIILSLDSTDDFRDLDSGTNPTRLISIDSEHDTVAEAMEAYQACIFSNKYLVQVIDQDESI